MGAKPVLVSCPHIQENYAAAISALDKSFNEWVRDFAIEQIPGRKTDFFGRLVDYAKSKGMNVHYIDSPYGDRVTNKLMDQLDFVNDFNSKSRTFIRHNKGLDVKLSKKILLIGDARTRIMVKN